MKPVIVRTYSAGVHYGYLEKREGKEVHLVKSRRLWYWEGANTLSEVATAGVAKKGCKLGAPISVVLTEAIEIIDCSAEASAQLDDYAPWK